MGCRSLGESAGPPPGPQPHTTDGPTRREPGTGETSDEIEVS